MQLLKYIVYVILSLLVSHFSTIDTNTFLLLICIYELCGLTTKEKE